MRSEIKRGDAAAEFSTEERCHIIEVANDANDPDLSIARARVEPGVTTAWHRLEGTAERYLVVSGEGRVEVGDLPPQRVGPGDVVRIGPGVAQRITNTGDLTQANVLYNQNPHGIGTGSGLCFGDSGSPQLDEGSLLVLSVTSGGNGQCNANNYNYRVDTALARDFLGQFLHLP